MNQIDRYTIKRELGRGGMATVYLAEDPRFGREVAVKTLPHNFLHDPQFRARFDQEARAIARLEHPAIVPVYDVGEQDEQPYLVMRYMVGGSLSERLRQRGVFRLDEALPIIQRIAAALDRAHRSGIIHRDLKPGNIMFDDDNNAYLGDFGIAYLAEASMAFTGSSIIGTPTYMSPEQARGDRKMDGRSDIYSLGVLLYEMLTGQPPYQADTAVGIAMRHINDPIPDVTDTNVTQPSSINLVVAKAMAKDREKRYQTGAEFARAVGNVVHGRVSVAPATAIINDSSIEEEGVTVPIDRSSSRAPVRPRSAPSSSASSASKVRPIKPAKKAAAPFAKGGANAGGIPGWLFPALGVAVLLLAFLAGSVFMLRTRTDNTVETTPLVQPDTLTADALAALDGTETTETVEPTATETPTSTPSPSASPSASATVTATGTSEPTETSTPQSTETSEPTNAPRATNTSTPRPRPTSTNTPRPQPTATNTLQPTSTSVPFTVAPVVVATTVRPTNIPLPTDTPLPAATVTSLPTNTPLPAATVTPPPTPTNTLFPTATNTPPLATPTSPSQSIITTFTANRATATVGDEIVIAWQVNGAPETIVLSQFINGSTSSAVSQQVSTVGQQSFIIQESEMNSREMIFRLDVDGLTSDTIRLSLTCNHDFFFTAPNILPNNLCPNAPVITRMGEHRFSGGTLYWLEAFDQIYIHLFNGTSRKLSDDWRLDLPVDSCPELTTANPEFKPTQGFGFVWCNNADIRAALGEPISGPSGFTSISQKARPNGVVEWIKVRGGHVLEIPANSGTWTERPNVTAD